MVEYGAVQRATNGRLRALAGAGTRTLFARWRTTFFFGRCAGCFHGAAATTNLKSQSVMLKSKPIRSQKLRDSARGEVCTFSIIGACNADHETTVLCHLPDDSGTGKMGGKSEDFCAAYGCSSCHAVIDGRVKNILTESDRQWYMRRAMVRTWRRMIEKGLIKIA